MNNEDYQSAAVRTASPHFNIPPADLLHAVLGLVTETGELADILKRYIYYNEGSRELDITHIEEEVGDLLWYIPLICREFNISLSGIMDKNIAKLKKRYPGKFTEEDARDRDLDTEREALETPTERPEDYIPGTRLSRSGAPICSTCAAELRGRWPTRHCATYWTGRCAVCQKEKGVVDTGDYLWGDEQKMPLDRFD